MASKGRLFHVADGEDGLCWLAQRVPAAQRTGDIHADNQLAMRRDAFVKVVDGLWKAPEHALEVATYLESLKAAKASAPSAGQMAKLTTLRALPESWQVGFLDAILKWGQEKFEQMKTYDPEAIRHLMAFAVNAAPSLRLSQWAGCKDADVLRETLQTRVAAAGQRLALLQAWCPQDGQSGRLPWEACGVYELAWSEGRVTSITHRPTRASVTLPQVVHVTEEFSLIDNWCEASSRLEMGPVKYGMMSFFLLAPGRTLCRSGRATARRSWRPRARRRPWWSSGGLPCTAPVQWRPPRTSWRRNRRSASWSSRIARGRRCGRRRRTRPGSAGCR